MKELFYSLFDISHEEDKTKPLFFYEKYKTNEQTYEDIRDVIEFANSTIKEDNELTKVRTYYFKSESTEVISIIKDIIMLYINNMHNEADVKDKLLAIAKRYSRTEREVIEKNPSINTPAPSNLFFVLSKVKGDNEEEKFHFFIAKIEKSEFLNSDELKILKGLPHKSHDKKNKKKSIKNWKTAGIYISHQVDADDQTILNIEKVIISDTNNIIATYWAESFLEATEVNDNEKNTLTAYNELKKIINNLNRSKDKTLQRATDVHHLISSLNSYFLNNNVFDFEKMVESVFSLTYTPYCPNLDMKALYEKAIKLKDSDSFDNNFTIVQDVIENKTKEIIKVSDKIDIRINKHTSDLNDIIISDVDKFGQPYIKIMVDSKENEAYRKFLKKSKQTINI